MHLRLSVSFFLSLLPFFLVCQAPVTKIAFGSCGHQDYPIPAFDLVVKHKAETFIFLGDNIYADTKKMDTMLMKYRRLERKSEFQNLKKNTKIMATWDDHDYGRNDGGKKYKYKEQSKKIFLDFFDEPAGSERRKHEGIYTSSIQEINGKKLQIILLDCRTFRDDLKKYWKFFRKKKGFFYNIDYLPHSNHKKNLLGEVQWKWLEEQLKEPADLRLICTGTQFGIEFNGYEAWANFPHEQQKFLELIKRTQASGILFLSGDVHYAEISKLNSPGLYPIYDITSSGLSSRWEFATPNINRIEGPVMDNNFGLLSIDWMKADPEITMEIWDISDNQRVEHIIRLSEISFKK